MRNYQGQGKCYQPRKGEADNTFRGLDNSASQKPNSIIVHFKKK